MEHNQIEDKKIPYCDYDVIADYFSWNYGFIPVLFFLTSLVIDTKIEVD